MQIKVLFSPVEELKLIVMSKSLHVELNNSADNLTIKFHLFVEAKEIAWNLGFKMYIALWSYLLMANQSTKKIIWLSRCQAPAMEATVRSNCLLYIFSNTKLIVLRPLTLIIAENALVMLSTAIREWAKIVEIEEQSDALKSLVFLGTHHLTVCDLDEYFHGK